MEDQFAWIQVFSLSLAAGLSMVLGAGLASWESIRPKWLEEELRHGIMAFGGGALFSAVALVLVPEGIKQLSLMAVVFWFVGGSLFFAIIDHKLNESGTPTANLLAMLSDFFPEALALGATFANGGSSALLLAALIALQNFPEGFSTYRELRQGGVRTKKIILGLLASSALGPVAGLFGFYILADSIQIVAAIMLFASGGILYLVFQDIAPQAKLDKKWLPALGAVIGFTLGLAGHILTG